MDFTPEQQAHIDTMVTEIRNKWIANELTPLQTQIQELEKFKPVEKTDKEKEIEAKEKDLFDKEVNLYLKEKGLHEFADFFNVQNMDEVKEKVEKLNKILESKKLNNSYVPDNHKGSADAYTKAEKNGDTLTMISTKLSKIFK